MPANPCPTTCPVCGPSSPVTIRPIIGGGSTVWERGGVDVLIGYLPAGLSQGERHRRALGMLRTIASGEGVGDV